MTSTECLSQSTRAPEATAPTITQDTNNTRTESTTTTTTTTSSSALQQSIRHVTFIHLDLGIGGAEQLILQLALATVMISASSSSSSSSNTSSSSSTTATTSDDNTSVAVEIVTTRCDPTHSFQEFKPPDGILYKNVKVVGRWIPVNLFGYGTALCSSLRMMYLSLYVIWSQCYFGCKQQQRTNRSDCASAGLCHHPDVIVLDVLPTSIPLLRYFLPQSGILFYCHFPDKLLTRNTVNGEKAAVGVTDNSHPQQPSFLARWYRAILNGLEEYTLNAAHVICVNSNFTKQTVQREFPSLRQRDMDVLYPAISSSSSSSSSSPTNDDVKTSQSPIVSLNRFERKKNVELLLYAYAELRRHYQRSSDGDLSTTTSSTRTTISSIPHVVIAGGYDPKNVENIEYMGELRRLTSELQLDSYVQFCPSISDDQRRQLLETALCVVYTPHLEHFGIVPLEAMLAGTPVICVNSGGPLETVLHNVTGYLCDPTPMAFCQALMQLLVLSGEDSQQQQQPQHLAVATSMGRAGKLHVQTKFGIERFRREWHALLQKTVAVAAKRQEMQQQQQQRQYSLWNSIIYILEAILMLLACILLTWLLKRLGWMDHHESILGKVRRSLWTDEL